MTRPPFNPTWHEQRFKRYGAHDWVAQAQAERDWRRAVADRFRSYPHLPLPHGALQHPDRVRVHTVFHACRREAALAICRGGFAQLASLDPGFYGQVLYFTFELEYAVQQYGVGEGMQDADGCVTVLVCNVVVSGLYPVIEHPDMRGRPQVPKYDAHGVVVEAGPCTPCPLGRWGQAGVRTYSELVLFEDAAILPRFVLAVRPA